MTTKIQSEPVPLRAHCVRDRVEGQCDRHRDWVRKDGDGRRVVCVEYVRFTAEVVRKRTSHRENTGVEVGRLLARWWRGEPSPMQAQFLNDVMTTQQLVDIAAFLRTEYEYVPPPSPPYWESYPNGEDNPFNYSGQHVD